MSLKRERAQLSIALDLSDGKPLPTEFRIFRKGENDTTKGVFLFDDAAAHNVMAAQADYGNDYSFDYNHASLRAEMSPNPAEAGKGAGQFNIDVRDGELWAVNVRWTPLAALYLNAKEYRYISPAFDFDGTDGTIIEMLNAALTNIPAMKNLTPLMASRATGTAPAAPLETAMTPELLKKLAKLTGLPDTATEAEVLAAVDAPPVEPPPGMKCAKCSLTSPEGSKFCAQCGQDLAPPADPADDDAAMPPAALARFSRQKAELDAAKAREATATAALERIENERLSGQFEAKATGFKALAQDPKKLGPVLMSLSKKAPEEYVAIEALLSSANKTISESAIFQEAGRGGQQDPAGARAKLDRLAQELVTTEATKGNKVSLSAARSRVLDSTPGLYAEVQAEDAAA